MLSNLINKLGEWNPQLFRELKGRLTPRNITIASIISIFGQGLLYLFYISLLPTANKIYSHYFINLDSFGEPIINWQLWWLDLFVCMSIISIFALLLVGTYMLIADLSKEESKGTLNFIRLSPQSAHSIFTGKMLGVPALLYFVGLLAIPLHIGAGLAAKIPLLLILSFYAVLIVSCAFFYNFALFYTLISSVLKGFKGWLISGALFYLLFLMTLFTMSSHTASYQTSASWLILFYPGTMLSYLVDATGVNPNYFELANLAQLRWFDLPLWKNAITGIGFTLANYCLWTYWLGQGIKRRFYNPSATSLSKLQSYCFSALLVFTMVGFALNYKVWSSDETGLFANFVSLLVFNLILFLGLIATLSPHRQTLQDWVRYRHKNGKSNPSLLKDLIVGEKSPSNVAIGINLAITSLMLLSAIGLLPFNRYKIPLLTGVVLNIGVILIYAAIAQLVLLMKNRKRAVLAIVAVASLIYLPLVIFVFLRVSPQDNPIVWFFSPLPVVATEHATLTTVLLGLLGQFSMLALVGFQMTRKLRKIGASETKALLSAKS